MTLIYLVYAHMSKSNLSVSSHAVVSIDQALTAGCCHYLADTRRLISSCIDADQLPLY